MPPLVAGIRLILYSFMISTGSVVAGIIASKKIVLPIYVPICSVFIQITSGHFSHSFPRLGSYPPTQYGDEAITGFGLGTFFGILLLLAPFVVTREI
jgi:hypothetical protein